MRVRVCGLAILSLFLVTSIGCGGGGGDRVDKTKVALDTSTRLGSLHCADEGIFPDDCVLDNPDNPFADSVFPDLKSYFETAEDLPSALSKYYLWATALANLSAPETQFLVAQSLHELYTEGGDPLARDQAIRAYRSALDEFFDAKFYFTADYLTGEPLVGIAIKNLIAANLANSFDRGLAPLVEPADELLGQAQALVGEWGYSIRLVIAPDLTTPNDPNDTVVEYIMDKKL